jgi:hypothetical protein
MTFSASIMERESVLHDINRQQSFEALLLKPNDQTKTRVHTTESHPIQQSLGMSPSRVCWRSLPKHDTLAISMGVDNRQIFVLA